MDSELAEALCLVSACNDLGHFAGDNPEDLKTLEDWLNNVDIRTCEDFRIAFVSNDAVSVESIGEFAIGDFEAFPDVLAALAEELIPEGSSCMGVGCESDRAPTST